MTARNALVLVNGAIMELPSGDTLNGASGTAADPSVSGAVTVDFGPAPGSFLAVATVIGQTSIGSNSQCDAWIMGLASPDHNYEEHMIAPITVRAGNIVPGVGFDIWATSDMRLTGRFNVQWVRTL